MYGSRVVYDIKVGVQVIEPVCKGLLGVKLLKMCIDIKKKSVFRVKQRGIKVLCFRTQKRLDSEGKVRHAIAEREPPR